MTARSLPAVQTNVISPSTARWLTIGQGVSTAGSRGAELATPILAVTELHAPAWQVGALSTAATAPYLLFGVAAGEFLERARLREVMLAVDVVRALLAASVPVLALSGHLSVLYLAIVVFLLAVGGTLFDVALNTYIPRVVGLQNLVAARGALASANRLGEIGGQLGVGALAKPLGAAIGMGFNAVSYAGSIISLIRAPSLPARYKDRDHTKARVFSLRALRFALSLRINRLVMIEAFIFNVFFGAYMVAFYIRTLSSLQWTSTWLALATSGIAAGAFIGAMAAQRLSRGIGVGRTIILGLVGSEIALLPSPWLLTRDWWSVAVIAVLLAVAGAGALISSVVAGALNRSLTPDDYLARLSGANKVFTRGGLAISGLVGGALVTTLGARSALIVSTFGTLAASAVILRPSIFKVRDLG